MVALPVEIAEVLSGSRRWAMVHADNAEVLPLLPDRSVAHVITGPPFTDRVSANARTNPKHAPVGDAHGFIDFAGIDAAEVAPALVRVAAAWAIAFCAMEQLGEYAAASSESWVRAGVWLKPDGAPQFTGDRPAQACEGVAIMHRPGRKRWNGGGGRGAWVYSVVQDRRDFGHPTPKPLPLMLELVELFTDPDEIVLDPFAGSGTTGVACLRLGRRFVGIEKDATYAATAKERLEAESQGLTLRDARHGQQSLFATPLLSHPTTKET